MTDVFHAMTADPPVERRDKPMCDAKTRASGAKRCKRPAGWGTDHPGVGRCKLHAGSTPGGRQGAARVIAERDVRKVLEALGEPIPVRNPTVRLLELLGEMDRFREAARVQVEQLEAWTSLDNFGAEQAKAIIRIYTEALDRLGRFLSDAARLKLEERLVEINEALAEQVLAVAERALMLAVPAEFHGPFKAAFAVEAQSREVVK